MPETLFTRNHSHLFLMKNQDFNMLHASDIMVALIRWAGDAFET